ncbi:hypothetical protein IAQ61_007621 [Plenodomus lingam]|uniref:Uncharacterized protein n=1 Tax=Leptosphaeria maculans (strain JN3 / isolate v23.1.3 / race Av1-4-5-6-7-8) TaxID=985895 RepID=E5A560_LEPMJ|nr:hypothetical protein LEMA_P079970.1 [Plenodomus lingam JN3]KAH9867030.1 hypothetical protein IAQ61_007621 [Plenodomus lingam]CBX98758.1 hypothetical protein LEMA_P079970.1 [Plenodomus lingam JN3]
MGSFWNKRNAVISGIAITILGTYFVYQSPTPLNFSMSKTSSDVPDLEFRLSQTSSSPPTILVTLKNTSPDTPYTLLKWGTPLDSAALNTGVFSIVGEEDDEEVKQFVLQINRKMPPAQEEVVTLVPGTEKEVEVVFDKPWMLERKPAKYKVKAVGDFKGLWDKDASDVTEQNLYAYIESPLSGKKFATNEIVMEVE